MFVKKLFMLLFENIADSIVEVRRLKECVKEYISENDIFLMEFLTKDEFNTALPIFYRKEFKELSKFNVKLLVFINLLDLHS